MKRTEKIRIPQQKPRMHMALFSDDLPFRGRRETPKNEYKRRPKNRREQSRDED